MVTDSLFSPSCKYGSYWATTWKWDDSRDEEEEIKGGGEGRRKKEEKLSYFFSLTFLLGRTQSSFPFILTEIHKVCVFLFPMGKNEKIEAPKVKSFWQVNMTYKWAVKHWDPVYKSPSSHLADLCCHSPCPTPVETSWATDLPGRQETRGFTWSCTGEEQQGEDEPRHVETAFA